MTALETHKESDQWQQADGRYIPYPATWLNDESWTDELDIETESQNPFGTRPATDEKIAELQAQGVFDE